jgi:uncharacterized LabA/DUF88 family protein
MRVNFYVDGLNLYYGLLKRRRPDLKWLDLRTLCESLTADHVVHRVRYFTAAVRGAAGNQGAHDRQHRYLRALEAVGGVDIHRGHFTRRRDSMPRADGSGDVEVWRTEEKCSDVNIGVHMILDAVNDDCEIMALISNDSDLRVPIRVVSRDPWNREVWVFNPTSREKCGHLSMPVHVHMRAESLEAAQLPLTVRKPTGEEIHKPRDWR